MMVPLEQTSHLASPLLPGCIACITVDGKPLTIYEAQTEGNKSICYVEAVEGAHFEVQFRDERNEAPPTDFNLDVYLDGRWVRGSTHQRTSAVFRMPLDHPHRLQTFRAARIDATTERPFLFSKIVQTDNDDLACKEERVIQGIGSISLRMMRIKDVRDKIEEMHSQVLTDIVIHEASKRVKLSHQTSLGPAQVTKVKRIAMKFDLIDTPSKPFVNFEFRYRSRTLLELEGHAPPLVPPAPSPAAADPRLRPLPSILKKAPLPRTAPKHRIDIVIESSDDEEDGTAEVERLRARIAELERQDRVKAEPATPKVKQEKATIGKKPKREKGASGRVVSSASGRGKKGRSAVIEID